MSAGMPRILTGPLLTKLSRQQLNVNAKDSLWDVLTGWGGSSDQLSTALWIPQKWDKAPNHLCWHIAHLWAACLAESSLLESCTALSLPRSSEAGLGGAVPCCSLTPMQFYSLYFCCCLGLAHEWDFTGQFKYEM